MCLLIDKKFHPDLKPIVAQRDIPVYKILLVTPHGALESPIQHHKYTKDHLEVSSMHIEDAQVYNNVGTEIACDKVWTVKEGLHAYTSFIMAEYRKCWLFSSRIFLGTIPKGSLYFKGTGDEIVSNQLIIKNPA